MSKRNVCILSIWLLCISLTMAIGTAQQNKVFKDNSTYKITNGLSIEGVTVSRIDTTGNGLYDILNLTVHVSYIYTLGFRLDYSFYGFNSTNQTTLLVTQGSKFLPYSIAGDNPVYLPISATSIVESTPNCSRFELLLHAFAIGRGTTAFTTNKF